MLALVLAIAVINIALGVAVARWSFTMKRHREAELVWRGEKYAQALDCYAQAQGGPPTRLEQLVEESCIRRLYTDPVSESGEWRVLRVADLVEEEGVASPAASARGPGEARPADSPVSTSGRGLRERLERAFSLDRERSAGEMASDRGGLPDRTSLRERVGAERGPDGLDLGAAGRVSEGDEMDGIVGVVSTNDEESIRPWQGARRYSDWRFMVGTSPPEVPRLPGLSAPSAEASPDGQTGEAAAGSESGSSLRERVRRSSGRGGR